MNENHYQSKSIKVQKAINTSNISYCIIDQLTKIIIIIKIIKYFFKHVYDNIYKIILLHQSQFSEKFNCGNIKTIISFAILTNLSQSEIS